MSETKKQRNRRYYLHRKLKEYVIIKSYQRVIYARENLVLVGKLYNYLLELKETFNYTTQLILNI